MAAEARQTESEEKEKETSQAEQSSEDESEPDEEEHGLPMLNTKAKGCEFELGLVGAGLGGGFANTAELKPMKYQEAMNGPDKKHWKKAVLEEHERFKKHEEA